MRASNRNAPPACRPKDLAGVKALLRESNQQLARQERTLTWRFGQEVTRARSIADYVMLPLRLYKLSGAHKRERHQAPSPKRQAPTALPAETSSAIKEALDYARRVRDAEVILWISKQPWPAQTKVKVYCEVAKWARSSYPHISEQIAEQLLTLGPNAARPATGLQPLRRRPRDRAGQAAGARPGHRRGIQHRRAAPRPAGAQCARPDVPRQAPRPAAPPGLRFQRRGPHRHRLAGIAAASAAAPPATPCTATRRCCTSATAPCASSPWRRTTRAPTRTCAPNCRRTTSCSTAWSTRPSTPSPAARRPSRTPPAPCPKPCWRPP